jgi:DNA transformation protein
VASDDIVELFSVFGPVTVRRMFGGAGIYAGGVMFALIADGAIYLKVGESNVAEFDREGLAPFSYERRKGVRAVMSYRRMPDRLYDDPEELAVWARAAVEAARQTKPLGKERSLKRSTAKDSRVSTRPSGRRRSKRQGRPR